MMEGLEVCVCTAASILLSLTAYRATAIEG